MKLCYLVGCADKYTDFTEQWDAHPDAAGESAEETTSNAAELNLGSGKECSRRAITPGPEGTQ